ncbi:hypothetical protein MXB_2862 [Myxobolus squamalis]|nr:hypothetical protein MXB_2862 [Myxobolus squamalis]
MNKSRTLLAINPCYSHQIVFDVIYRIQRSFPHEDIKDTIDYCIQFIEESNCSLEGLVEMEIFCFNE